MGVLFSKLMQLFSNREHKVIIVGLDNAGKTTILYQFLMDEVVHTSPTIGSNVEEIVCKKSRFVMWDIGGQESLRSSWSTYYANSDFVILVVDSTDRERLHISKEELYRMLQHEDLKRARLLVFANKQDVKGHMSAAEISQQLKLTSLKDHTWQIQACCALTGEGIIIEFVDKPSQTGAQKRGNKTSIGSANSSAKMDALFIENDSSQLKHSPQHLQYAWHTLDEFRLKGLFCDVVLKAGDVRFPAHRLVLCTCSDYFRSLFLGRWSSSDKREIEIPGMSPMVLALLLNYAYTGQITVTPSNVSELLPAADQFLVEQVKKKCCDFLEARLDLGNCFHTREYARHYFCLPLAEASTAFILRHFENLSRVSPEMMELNFKDFKALIDDDRLNARAEEVVCEAIFRWVSHDRPNRLQYFTSLLKCVRLGLLEPEYFMSKVKGHSLVLESMPECRTLIREAMKVVCDLDTRDNASTAQDNIYNMLLRPRLPFELLIAIGGWSGGSPTNAIEAYDPRAEVWVNASTLPDSSSPGQYRTIADLPCAYHGLAYVKGFIYVLGGFDGGNYFNTVRRMNVATLEWVQEPCMLHKRCYISVAVMDRQIYALGGMNGERRLNSGEIYNPVQKIWSDLPDMNEKRSDACATTLNGKIYIAGGFNGQECLFTAEFYDPAVRKWTRITPMRSRRSGVSIISYNGLVYAVGGFDGINRLRHAEAYSPITNSWKNISNMASPRSNFGIEILDGKLMVVGGYNGQRTTADVEMYDDATNEWYPVKDMHITRSGLSCCVISGVSYDVLKQFCIQRYSPPAEDPHWRQSRHSELSIEEGDMSPYFTLSPLNDADIDEMEIA